MRKVFNSSSSRVAIHTEGSKVYRVECLGIAELPDDIARQIITGWRDCQYKDEIEGAPLATEPWELRCGPAFDAAVKEHKIDLDKMKNTVGPDRPEVVDEPIPADAIDPITGHVNEAKLNTHLCTYCQKEFDKITKLRKHQKDEHGV